MADWGEWSRQAVTSMQVRNQAWIARFGLPRAPYRWDLATAELVFERAAERAGQLGALRGTSGEELSREARNHAGQWSLERYADVLAKKRVLLLAATQDEAVALSEVFEPLGAKLRTAGAQELTTLTLLSDHVFSSARIKLAQTLTRWLCDSR